MIPGGGGGSLPFSPVPHATTMAHCHGIGLIVRQEAGMQDRHVHVNVLQLTKLNELLLEHSDTYGCSHELQAGPGPHQNTDGGALGSVR